MPKIIKSGFVEVKVSLRFQDWPRRTGLAQILKWAISTALFIAHMAFLWKDHTT